MPIGIFANSFAVCIGGVTGAFLGKKLPRHLSETLNTVMGFVAFAITVSLIVKVKTLAAVALSVILGTAIGCALHLNSRISRLFSRVNTRLFKTHTDDDLYNSRFTSLLMLCCASGTGVFGAITEGLSGDSTILFCKAILDFTTVMIFASSIGISCSIIAIPQMFIHLLLFFSARGISPMLTDLTRADFSAVGGVVELSIALCILNLSKLKPIDTLPAMILIFPLSVLWNVLF